ncbi:Alpha/Beta hydrolase protein [Macrophomina phaseolina]|uniref:Alpha/Beta hydrolase protein n=1 Tax=Macrophomina phaseolina TaxID=35725 RepID=A0ABQ8G2N2_9PEZI|nr:Alpha/Beta hydrolase protein [Macrophomina phaseolina]
MNDKNPAQVQFAPRFQQKPSTPLVLIHDGGGTTFSYFTLGSLRRSVWAIHNPNFFTAEQWEGGMDEMARHYIGLMYDAGISGTILLGGWSLGGFLSLAIARALAADENARIFVSGLLIIDSPFHTPWSKVPHPTAAPDLPGLPDLVIKSLDNCEGLLTDWDLPVWDEPACEGKRVRFNAAGKSFTVSPGNILYKPLDADWRNVEVPRFEHTGEPSDHHAVIPPAVMLRCVGRVPAKDNSPHTCRVDLPRDDIMLGWGGTYPDFIKAVLDVDSHHYNIFDLSRVKTVTAQINDALGILESVRPSLI